jgi:dihydrofolate reductase
MRKIVAGVFLSLDGVMESPEKWHFPYFNDEMGAVVGGQMAETDGMLLGRVTWQEFAGFWPQQPADEEPAPFMNGVRKYVVSTTLDSVDAWQNSTLIRGDLATEIRKLKDQPGGTIGVTGSGTLIQSLLRENLLDELSLLVHPLTVGEGKRLFTGATGQRPLELVDSTTFSTGVLHLVYRPATSE